MSVAQLRLKAFDSDALTTCLEAVRTLATVHGVEKVRAVSLPRTRRRFTVLRSPHVYKKAREQFQLVTHSRLVCLHVKDNTTSLVDLVHALQHAAFPGVQVEWVLKSSSVATGGS